MPLEKAQSTLAVVLVAFPNALQLLAGEEASSVASPRIGTVFPTAFPLSEW